MKSIGIIVVVAGVLYYALQELPKPTFTVHTSGAVVVTGASSGIGLHAAIHLASLGYTVFPGVRKQADADAATKECAASHEDATCAKFFKPVIVDVTQQDSIDECFETVSKWVADNKQPFVALVNNAGVSQNIPVELAPLTTYRSGQLFPTKHTNSQELSLFFLSFSFANP